MLGDPRNQQYSLTLQSPIKKQEAKSALDKYTLDIVIDDQESYQDQDYVRTSNRVARRQSFQKTSIQLLRSMRSSTRNFNNYSGKSNSRKQQIFSNDNDHVAHSQKSNILRNRRETIDDILMGSMTNIYNSPDFNKEPSIRSRGSLPENSFVGLRFTFDADTNPVIEANQRAHNLFFEEKSNLKTILNSI